MKRVTIVVPDKMSEVNGVSKDVDVDERTILLALVTNDYHENWYFSDPKSIWIESIEDC